MHWPVPRIEPRRSFVFPLLHAGRDLADIVGSCGTGGWATVRQRIGQFLQSSACIAPECNLGRDTAPDLLGDDVEMDHRYMGWWQCEAFGGDLAKFAADDDQAIRALNKIIGDA